MFCVGNQSGNVPPSHQTCHVVASMHDEAWNVEWGNLRPLYSNMGSWKPIQHFGGSCHPVQEQSVSKFHQEELDSDEDDNEPPQIGFCEEALLELPSIGSKDHAIGECKRCAFFFKGRCRNGKECSHCHLPHDATRRKRNRRKAKGSAMQVEDNADYEGDLDDDVMSEPAVDFDVISGPPVVQARVALSGTPVHLPATASHQGFDGMLVFGSVTPELQPQVTSDIVSCSQKNIDEDEQGYKAPTVAFASLWNENQSSSSQVSADSINLDEDAVALALMEAEAALLEEEALAAEKEARRLELLSNPLASFPTYYQDHILRSCGNKYFASLHACFHRTASMPVPETTEHEALAKKNPSIAADEAETTASSEENTSGSSEENNSDACGTRQNSASNCSDKADHTSSDSDVSSRQGSKQIAVLSEELFPSQRERRHRKASKPLSDAVRASKRSPLWPSCLPTAGPSDSPVIKAVLPSGEESDKKADSEGQKKTSWAAQARRRRQCKAEDPDVLIVRKARSILNKLTDANFETLYTQLVECGICSATQLEALIMEIFEKATAQHGFLPMYVELCVKLNSHFEKEPIEGADFRKVLVGACQRTFEKTLRLQPEVDKNLSYEDRYEIELKFKTRMLGNLRFIGELLVQKLLAGKVLLAVSEELLSGGDGASIEAAATLLTVAGSAFDRKSWTFLPRLHAIFSMLRCMSKDPAIPMRVRCILKDLLDLRDAGWQKKK
eukprot:gnl/MRDRNA2_/MRDRNA2_94363_c0_seq1.p1 gnl/MRDRNA2_/MRDRNA2_94363_c0~~gnl/MRDRNA2_/MRDRNA2_94363_c0_seq1.p1  ORF type:complete len:729 (+),score=159.11 gnl/MRDRNA2_/MRDRNA2_94363_c0_seq1:99-2285(+)